MSDISSHCNSPRFNLSVKFLIELLLSHFTKISFSNFLLISEIVLLFTEKITNALCWSKETKSFLSLLTRGIMSLHMEILEKFPSRILPQEFPLKKCGVKLVTETNQPVARPPPTSYVYSQAKHFSLQPVKSIGTSGMHRTCETGMNQNIKK